MAFDQPRLRRALRGVRGMPGTKARTELNRIAGEIARSSQTRALRERNLPCPEFPEDLPVSGKRSAIAAAIRAHPVVVVCGETGSGKTTQLPKICLTLGRGARRHDRSYSAATDRGAQRGATHRRGTGSESGALVGYKVRFNDRTATDTHIKVMTDGILLAETQGDRLLRRMTP